MERLTKEQAKILTAFTGYLCGDFSSFHEYAERLLGRPVHTFEFAEKEIKELLHKLSSNDFKEIAYMDIKK